MEDGLGLTSLQTIEKLYQEYQRNPEKVSPYWQSFFEGMDFASKITNDSEGGGDLRIYMLIASYRKYGHLFTRINPIDPHEPQLPEQLKLETLLFEESDLDRTFPTFGFLEKPKAPLREIIKVLQGIYCSRIGFEYMDVEISSLKHWIQSKLEPKLNVEVSFEDKKLIMEYLNKAELFESFLNMKYVGQTRFSLEGGETFIPLMAFLIEKAAELGVDECVLGTAHRGRMNLLANIFRKSYAVIFHEFEANYLPLAMEGTSDVKYHKGFSSDFQTRKENNVHLHMAANPSHLESVNPVVVGQVRAKQVHKKDTEKKRTLPILIHGEAALSAQGVIYELMGMMNVDGYNVGGTVHIVLNNQIGFTTLPEEGRSTRYPTDIAKAFGCPIFHVNAEDPESCVYASALALEIRERYQIDVFISLNCYRKYGHNEGDEPFFTQPLQYKLIKSKKTPREIYRDELLTQGVLEKEIAETYEKEFRDQLRESFEKMQTFEKEPPHPEQIFGTTWRDFLIEGKPLAVIDTKVDASVLKEVAEKSAEIPQNFSLHPKLKKWLEDRKNKFNEDPKKPVFDWAFAEHLAFGSLLMQGIPIRLTGQDSRRGTFNQRHAVFVDQENAEQYFPLQHLKENQGTFDVYNSTLSEFAAMGFEYGYSLSSPQSLVLWEAQYGDFVNGAQIILDQYLTTGEMKWNRRSGLVLLLPHGYEGGGPEHSSARMERFLQLSAEDNIQVVYPSTPAQYFHLLRKQAIRKLRKPLIVFTPKSLLRHPLFMSSLEELSKGSFQEILDDKEIESPKKLLFCSGKIYYDLIQEREKRNVQDIAIVRIEELYPLDLGKIELLLKKYKNVSDVFWVQEEPRNMGAWGYMHRRLLPLVELKYIGRDHSASPAAGSYAMFKKSQNKIINEVFGEAS